MFPIPGISFLGGVETLERLFIVNDLLKSTLASWFLIYMQQ